MPGLGQRQRRGHNVHLLETHDMGNHVLVVEMLECNACERKAPMGSGPGGRGKAGRGGPRLKQGHWIAVIILEATEAQAEDLPLAAVAEVAASGIHTR